MVGYKTKGDNNKELDVHVGDETGFHILPKNVKAKIYLGKGCRNMIKEFNLKIGDHPFQPVPQML